MFNLQDLFRVYRNDDAGADTGGSSTSVQTEDDTGDSDSLLTGDNGSEDNTDTGESDEGGEGGDTDTTQQTDGEGSRTAPDTYADFAMPEGVEVDAELLAEATPIFKELGLTQEQAQKLVDFQAKQVQASSQRNVDAFNQLMNDWQEQSKNDKEFGGDKFDENIKIARSAISKFGTPELKQLLEEHGVGNHPEVIRFMVKVGKLTAEDVPGNQTGAPSEAKDRVSTLYPT